VYIEEYTMELVANSTVADEEVSGGTGTPVVDDRESGIASDGNGIEPRTKPTITEDVRDGVMAHYTIHFC
jgi:hypothetical protein